MEGAKRIVMNWHRATVWSAALLALAVVFWLGGCAHNKAGLNPSREAAGAGHSSMSSSSRSIDQLLSRVEAVEAGMKRLDVEVDELRNDVLKLLARTTNHSELDAKIRRIQAELSQLPDKLHAQLLDDVSKQLKTLMQPSASPTGTLRSTYEVAQGDTLESIAAMPDVYGDKNQWLKLYEANRDLIAGPNDLSPGMILIIPREAEGEQK